MAFNDAGYMVKHLCFVLTYKSKSTFSICSFLFYYQHIHIKNIERLPLQKLLFDRGWADFPCLFTAETENM